MIGATPDGDVNWDPRWAPHLLVCGDTSSGKSSLLRAILTSWRSSVVLLDPKRLEFGNWPEQGRVLQSTGDPIRIAQLLRQWADEVDRRMDALSHVNATHWTDSGAELLGLKPVLIVLDEAMVALTRPVLDETEKETKVRTDRARQALIECLVLGRASGVHVVVGLQRPDASFLGGGAARDQLRARVALGRLSADGCRMMFGLDMSDQMDGRPGIGLAVDLSSAMSTPVPFRSAWISPRDIRSLYDSGPESG